MMINHFLKTNLLVLTILTLALIPNSQHLYATNSTQDKSIVFMNTCEENNSRLDSAYEAEWRTFKGLDDFIVTDNYVCAIIDKRKKTAYIMRMKGIKGDITIPTQISGYKIIGIFDNPTNDSPDWVDSEDFGVIIPKDRGSITSITFQKGIEWIGTGSFYGLTKVNQITIPDTVKQIGRGAFNSVSIKKLEIPFSVSKIYEGAFSNCDQLESVKFNGNTTIERSFAGCINLHSIIIPNGNKMLQRQFEGCTNLQEYYLHEDVLDIYPEYINWKSVKKLVVSNSNCILHEMTDINTKAPLGYEYLKTNPDLTIISVKDSKIIKLAKDNNIKYIEVTLPNKIKGTKITRKKNISTISWTKESDASGYQIYYSKTKNGSYNLLTSTKNTCYKTTKTGYIKIRAYKEYENLNWYGDFVVKKITK